MWCVGVVRFPRACCESVAGVGRPSISLGVLGAFNFPAHAAKVWRVLVGPPFHLGCWGRSISPRMLRKCGGGWEGLHFTWGVGGVAFSRAKFENGVGVGYVFNFVWGLGRFSFPA